MPSLVKSTFWSAIQRFGGLTIGFISNVVLARLLCPEDYGIVGLIMVFISIADVLVDGGLGNALIQKKEVTKDDISTVFTSNLLLSLVLFLTIFFAAPAIAKYVEIDGFALFLRVEAIMILLRALYVIHFSMINREMDFQKLAKISLLVSSLSTLLAISMAYCGCGVWSLIARNLSLDLFSFLLYYTCYKVDFSLYIKKNAFKQLFSFGIFVAIANLLESLYSNLLSFILGKKFSVKELGYYNQAYALEQIPVYSITSILNQVFFPFLSKEQDDREKMRDDVQTSLLAMSFCVYPLMVYLICFAQPIIVLLYSEKWLPSVPFFQILCTLGFTNFLYHLNRSILKAVGETKIMFYSQVAVCVIGLLLIFMAIPYGIYAVVIMVAANSVIGMIIVICFAGKHIGFDVLQQLRTISQNLILSVIAGAVSYLLFSYVSWSELLLIPVSFVVYVIVYLMEHFFIKSKSLSLLSTTVENYFNIKFKSK